VVLRRFREVCSEDPVWGLIDNEKENLSYEDLSKIKQFISNQPEKIQVTLNDLRQKCIVQPHDIGIGISQLIPVLVSALSDSVSIAAIEQPELHIHPALQCRLADIFIACAIKKCVFDGVPYWAGRKFFILETHSEYLLLRLLRRIRETTNGDLPGWLDGLRPENLSINFVDFVNGKYHVQKLNVSEDGDSFGPWPKGFFEERAGELY